MKNYEISSMPTVQGSSIMSILKSCVIAIATTFIVFIFLALALTYTNMSENLMSPVVFITTLLCLILAGFLSGIKSNRSGWLYGLLSGVCYFLCVLIMSLIFNHKINFSLNTIMTLIFGLLLSSFGGILGINMRKNKKTRR